MGLSFWVRPIWKWYEIALLVSFTSWFSTFVYLEKLVIRGRTYRNTIGWSWYIPVNLGDDCTISPPLCDDRCAGANYGVLPEECRVFRILSVTAGWWRFTVDAADSLSYPVSFLPYDYTFSLVSSVPHITFQILNSNSISPLLS